MLKGKRIIITRPIEQADRFKQSLVELGAIVYNFPTIELRENISLEMELLTRKICFNLKKIDLIVFTSQNGVKFFLKKLLNYLTHEEIISSLKGKKIIAIGTATSKILDCYGVNSIFPFDSYVSESIVEVIESKFNNVRLDILLPLALTTRKILFESLGKMNHRFLHFPVYLNCVPQNISNYKNEFQSNFFDLITFTSASSFKNFIEFIGPIKSCNSIASIGPITTKTIKNLNYQVDIEAEKSTVEFLTKAIIDYYQN